MAQGTVIVTTSNLKPDDLFRCTLCGDCCRGYGGTYVRRDDIAAIARFTHPMMMEFMKSPR